MAGQLYAAHGGSSPILPISSPVEVSDPLSSPQPHFEHDAARWAAIGATIGALAVLVVFVGAMAITGGGTDLLGVAGLGISFGGGGLGAMLGAVLASVREPTLQQAPAQPRADELGHTASTS